MAPVEMLFLLHDTGTLVGRQRPIGTAGHRFLRQRESQGVGGKGARIAAEHVPGELVEHDDFRKGQVLIPKSVYAGHQPTSISTISR